METKYLDYTIPEEISIHCHKGHNITEQKCNLCKRIFADIYKFELGYLEVGCSDENNHICDDCYEKFFEED